MDAPERGWLRFEGWCRATGRAPLPADTNTVLDFLSRHSLAPSTVTAWTTGIRRAHESAGLPSPVPPPEPTPREPHSGLLDGDQWLPVDEAVRRCPRHGLTGLYGRRDAVALVLVAAGVSRAHVRDLIPDHVDLDAWTVRGQTLDRDDDPIICSRCVLVRWLDLLWAVHYGQTSDRNSVLFAPPESGHACERGVNGSRWRTVPCLVPSINQWRMAEDRGLSAEAVRQVLVRRQSRHAPELTDNACARTLDPPLVERVDVRMLRSEMDELEARFDDLLDDLERRAGAVLEKDAQRW